MDPIVRSRELSATDLLPPPDSRAIEAASLWSDDPPASASTPPVALSPVPVVAKPKATKHSSPFRLMLAQAVRRSPAHAFFFPLWELTTRLAVRQEGDARPRAGTGTETLSGKTAAVSAPKPGGSMRGQAAWSPSGARNAFTAAAAPAQTTKRAGGLTNSQLVEEAVARSGAGESVAQRRARDSDGRRACPGRTTT